MRRHWVSSGEATVAAGAQNIPRTLHQMRWQGTDTECGNCFGGLAVAVGNGLSPRVIDGGNFLKKPTAIGGSPKTAPAAVLPFAFMEPSSKSKLYRAVSSIGGRQCPKTFAALGLRTI
jgi:hypothetical protein